MVAENLWSTIRLTRAATNAVQVEVTGVQFQWYFRYPGPDGIYGTTRPDLVDAAGGNPLGLDPADPHSHDDVVSSVLVLPAGQQANIRTPRAGCCPWILYSRHARHAERNPRYAIADPSHTHTHRRLRHRMLTALRNWSLSYACRAAGSFRAGFLAWMAQRQAALKEK